MSDLIERSYVLDTIENFGILDGYSDRVELMEKISKLPSIETIYGYHFNELAFVASILAKEGVSPTELTRIIWDAERIATILCKEIKDNFQKAMKVFKEYE